MPDAMLDNAALKDLLGKVVTPTVRRGAAMYLRQALDRSERRACRVIGTDGAGVRYQSLRTGDGALRKRLKAPKSTGGSAIAACTFCCGGNAMPSIERGQRLYREERLSVRLRGGRRRAIGTRRPIEVPLRPPSAGA